MKNKKKLFEFPFSINMANFEAFCRTKKLISNLFFLKSGHIKPSQAVTQAGSTHLSTYLSFCMRAFYIRTLFRKKRFEINFFVRQNASKFAMFIEKENLGSFFIFHFKQLSFFPYECPGLCQHRQLSANLFFLKSKSFKLKILKSKNKSNFFK